MGVPKGWLVTYSAVGVDNGRGWVGGSVMLGHPAT